jgi:hypothetical protein
MSASSAEAIRLLGLTPVQPILVCDLIFAVVISAVLWRRWDPVVLAAVVAGLPPGRPAVTPEDNRQRARSHRPANGLGPPEYSRRVDVRI